MDKKIYLSVLAALATAAAVWFFAQLTAPVIKPLAWALIIGVSTMPHHNRLAALFPRHPNRVAGLMVLVVTLCIILPATALIVTIAQNAADWYAETEQLVLHLTRSVPETLGQSTLGSRMLAFADRFGLDLAGYAAKFAASASQFLMNAATSAAKNLAGLIFTLAMALFILFFIYRDGARIVEAGVARFADNREKTLAFLGEIRSTTIAVTVGTILTCLVQGVIAGIGYFVAGVPAPVLCGALTAVAAIIPVVGTALVWVPLVILLAIGGAYLKAGLLALWCVVFVGLSDNAIRPLAIGAKSNIPVPAVVFGAVGGAAAMGLLGLILGPVVFAILVTIWREMTAADPTGEA